MVETNVETHLPHCAQTENMCGQIEYQIASGKPARWQKVQRQIETNFSGFSLCKKVAHR